MRYLIKDFFLNSHYRVFKPHEADILANEKGMIFPTLCNETYIEGFTGIAFEQFVRYCLSLSGILSSVVAEKLFLRDSNFVVGSGYLVGNSQKLQNSSLPKENLGSQVDVLIRHENDGIVRVIECKWTKEESLSHVSEVINKRVVLLPNEQRLNALCVSYTPSAKFQKAAREAGVPVVQLEDLMSI